MWVCSGTTVFIKGNAAGMLVGQATFPTKAGVMTTLNRSQRRQLAGSGV